MATTKLGLPTITGNMTNDVVRDMNALAQAVDDKVGVPNGLATLDENGNVNGVDLSTLATKEELSTHLAEDAQQFANLVSSENLVPLFDTGLWSLHANATVNSPRKITLNATAISQETVITLSVNPNTNYTVTMLHNSRYSIETVDRSSFILGQQSDNLPHTFNTGTNSQIVIVLTNTSTGTFTFENIMLVEGTETPSVFLPRFREDIPNLVIVESGSNANGEYVKFADGTMICFSNVNIDLGVDTLQIFTMPATFVTISGVYGSYGNTGTTWKYPILKSTLFMYSFISFHILVNSPHTASTLHVCTLVAIGRWK